MTAPLQARFGASVRLDPFWQQVKARLATPETLTILRNGKVYLDSEDYGRDENTTPPWGRQVVIPATTLWPVSEVDSSYRAVNWVVRSEMKPVVGTPDQPTTYNVAIPLERLQQIAYEVLVGWAPAASGGVLVRLPCWRQRASESMPSWDADRGLWWLSSEYRTEVTRT